MAHSWLAANPGAAGCRCPQCFGAAEYMLQLTGRTYGLARARGHAPLPVKPAESQAIVIDRRRAARQPWEPRPPRSAHRS